MSPELHNLYQAWAEKYPFAATTVETVALYAARKVIRMTAEKIDLPISNGHAARQIEEAAEHPAIMGAMTVVVSPVLEELVFRRAMPNFVNRRLGIDRQSQSAKTVRQVLTLAFAATHIGNPATAKGRENLALPILPLIGGMNYERLNRKRGFKYAVWGHAVNNTLALTEAVPVIKQQRKVCGD